MLRSLHIQNYAIIEDIVIHFSPKLNIITGETGAGKSILMGALALILGERAETGVLLNRDRKCIVEGLFATGYGEAIAAFLEENDLDKADELLLRREIGINGKSRAFVNDTPVNLEQLRVLSALLVDLHQQFDTLTLGESDFQRAVVDALAGHAVLLQEYRQLYQQWKQCGKALAELQEEKKRFSATYDYNKFLYEELETAALKENELEEAEAELKLLGSVEGIKAALERVDAVLNEGEQPMVAQLKALLQQLQPYSGIHPELPVIVQRLQSVQSELSDIAGDINRTSDHIQYDPQRAEALNERISIGYKLLKKHGVQSTADLLVLQNKLSEKLGAVLDLDDTIAAKEKAVNEFRIVATGRAEKLSASRQKQAKPLEDKVNRLLVQVGMPNARLKVVVQPADLLQPFGIDTIEFLFDANRSGRFEPVRKVASGGELSRLMLCIKSLVAQSLDLPTLIFDEIDTGISGEAAKQVGLIMKELAASRQVIAITHQPQIAGRADAHFLVYKEAKGETVKTNMRLLSQEERITTIARMLGGEKPTAAALANAREMVMP
jgi:DNA repair protein RecN (Recombination protein N)